MPDPSLADQRPRPSGGHAIVQRSLTVQYQLKMYELFSSISSAVMSDSAAVFRMSRLRSLADFKPDNINVYISHLNPVSTS